MKKFFQVQWLIFFTGVVLAVLYFRAFPIFFLNDSIGYLRQALAFSQRPIFLLVYPVNLKYAYFGIMGQMLFGNAVIPVVIFQHLLLITAAVMMYRYGSVVHGKRLGVLWVAALLLNGPLLFYAHTYMTESLNISFSVLALMMLGLELREREMGWRNPFIIGLFFGFAFLARATALLLPLLYVSAILVFPLGMDIRTKSRIALIMILGFSLVYLPSAWQIMRTSENDPYYLNPKSLYLFERIADFHMEDETLPKTRNLMEILGEQEWKRLKTATTSVLFEDIGSREYQERFTKMRGHAILSVLGKDHSIQEIESLIKGVARENLFHHPFSYGYSVWLSFLDMTGINGILGMTPLPGRTWYAWDWGEKWDTKDLMDAFIARPEEFEYLIAESGEPAKRYALVEEQDFARDFQAVFYRWFSYEGFLKSPLGKLFYEFSRMAYPIPWLWTVLSVLGMVLIVRKKQWDLLVVLAIPFLNNLIFSCFLTMPAQRSTILIQPFWTFLAFYPLGVLWAGPKKTEHDQQ